MWQKRQRQAALHPSAVCRLDCTISDLHGHHQGDCHWPLMFNCTSNCSGRVSLQFCEPLGPSECYRYDAVSSGLFAIHTGLFCRQLTSSCFAVFRWSLPQRARKDCLWQTARCLAGNAVQHTRSISRTLQCAFSKSKLLVLDHDDN